MYCPSCGKNLKNVLARVMVDDKAANFNTTWFKYMCSCGALSDIEMVRVRDERSLTLDDIESLQREPDSD